MNLEGRGRKKEIRVNPCQVHLRKEAVDFNVIPGRARTMVQKVGSRFRRERKKKIGRTRNLYILRWRKNNMRDPVLTLKSKPLEGKELIPWHDSLFLPLSEKGEFPYPHLSPPRGRSSKKKKKKLTGKNGGKKGGNRGVFLLSLGRSAVMRGRRSRMLYFSSLDVKRNPRKQTGMGGRNCLSGHRSGSVDDKKKKRSPLNTFFLPSRRKRSETVEEEKGKKEAAFLTRNKKKMAPSNTDFPPRWSEGALQNRGEEDAAPSTCRRRSLEEKAAPSSLKQPWRRLTRLQERKKEGRSRVPDSMQRCTLLRKKEGTRSAPLRAALQSGALEGARLRGRKERESFHSSIGHGLAKRCAA